MSKYYKSQRIIINDLFGRSETFYPKFYERLRNKTQLNICDLGSSVPVNLFLAYHVFNCNKLTSVDVYSENGLVKGYKNRKLYKKHPDYEQIENANSFYDIYSIDITPDETCELEKIKDKEYFDKVFLENFHKKSIWDFLNDFEEKQNVIIASNILHILIPEKQKECLIHISNLLTEDGILIIRIQNKLSFSQEKFMKIYNEIFPNSEVFETYKGTQWDHSIIINHIGLLD